MLINYDIKSLIFITNKKIQKEKKEKKKYLHAIN
jgi:hypothetical protein